MKKLFTIISVLTLAILMAACGKEKENKTYCDELAKVENAKSLKIGMVTDSGTITDKSFNQGTWDGIKCYVSKNPGEEKYVQPSGEEKVTYLSSIKNLVDAGHDIIITPGYKFETAILEAQDTYENVKFVLIDGIPNNGAFDETRVEKVSDNTVSIYFAEQQAGFLAGVAAALSTETNKLGFIGGMEIPAVQKFGWGFVAGVAYANENFDTNAEVIDYVYQGTFKDTAAGQSLAAGMYDKGIDVIFTAAGGVGVGVFTEAKNRADSGDKVWVVGVDSDQYDLGKYGDLSKSVTLTSALKRVDVAAYDSIAKLATDKWSDFGGKVLNLDITDNAVGLPIDNPNLSDATQDKCDEAAKDLKDGKITVPDTKEDLITYLSENNYTTPSGVEY
ncbi:BMP family ABC transporter substrate-binding protein [Mycoplasmatota bacterium]|nr:BMP family ABC transporter substrate-binding protein [Mycoplasmatota bacterium]